MTATTVPVEHTQAPTPPAPAGPRPDRPAEARTGASEPKDPRYLALRNFAMSISVFNIFGYTLLGFEQPWLWPFLALATGYTTEIVFELISAWADKRSPRFRGNGPRGLMEFLLPAHITSLAVNMLLYANNQFWPVAFGRGRRRSARSTSSRRRSPAGSVTS